MFDQGKETDKIIPILNVVFSQCFASSVSDIKNAALTTLVLASRETKPDKALAEQFVPLLLSCLRDKSTTVKSGAERALLAVLNLRQGNDFYEVFTLVNVLVSKNEMQAVFFF